MHHYPGFIDRNKHPEGMCMPCCFKYSKGKTSAKQDRLKEECQSQIAVKPSSEEEKKEERDKPEPESVPEPVFSSVSNLKSIQKIKPYLIGGRQI